MGADSVDAGDSQASDKGVLLNDLIATSNIAGVKRGLFCFGFDVKPYSDIVYTLNITCLITSEMGW